MRDTWVRSLDWEHPLEKGKATHSSIMAWRIPWTVESDTAERLSFNQITTKYCISWAPESLRMVTAAMKLKDACCLEGKL